MSQEEILYTMALTRMTGISLGTALHLYRQIGSAKAVYDHRGDIGDVLTDGTPRLAEALRDWSLPLARAEQEMAFVQKHGIGCLCLNDADYPQRLTRRS